MPHSLFGRAATQNSISVRVPATARQKKKKLDFVLKAGLSLNDVPTILTGAIPAALMAWLAHLAFDMIGKLVISPGLQRRA